MTVVLKLFLPVCDGPEDFSTVCSHLNVMSLRISDI